MRKLIGLLFLIVTVLGAEDKEVVKKVVYDLTTGDIATFERKVLSGIVAHHDFYQSKLEELKVRVMVHGDAYKFFIKDLHDTPYAKEHALVAKQAEFKKRLKTLAMQYDVKFEVCDVGVRMRKLNKKAFYPFVSFVHSAPVGLIDAQNDGYAYLPLH